MSEEQGVGIADVAESGIVNDRASVFVLISNFLIAHARVKTQHVCMYIRYKLRYKCYWS